MNTFCLSAALDEYVATSVVPEAEHRHEYQHDS